jgi:hypothetical protein
LMTLSMRRGSTMRHTITTLGIITHIMKTHSMKNLGVMTLIMETLYKMTLSMTLKNVLLSVSVTI